MKQVRISDKKATFATFYADNKNKKQVMDTISHTRVSTDGGPPASSDHAVGGARAAGNFGIHSFRMLQATGELAGTAVLPDYMIAKM